MKFDNFESLNATKERENVLVMFYGDPISNPSEYELFFNMTDKFQHLHFYYFSNSSIIPHLNLGEEISSPSIVILKNFDEEINAYTGKITFYDVYQFIRIFSRPVLSNLNPDSYLYIINERISFISLMIPENHPKIEEIKELYYDLSLNYRNKLMSFIGHYEELKGTTFTYEFNVKSSDLPIIMIEEFTPENTIRRYKSVPSDLESNSTITSFFTRYYEGFLL